MVKGNIREYICLMYVLARKYKLRLNPIVPPYRLVRTFIYSCLYMQICKIASEFVIAVWVCVCVAIKYKWRYVMWCYDNVCGSATWVGCGLAGLFKLNGINHILHIVCVYTLGMFAWYSSLNIMWVCPHVRAKGCSYMTL